MFALRTTRKINLLDSEQTYLLQIREGDREAFEVVFKTYYEDLGRYAFSLLKRQDDSEDLVQQVFVNFWEKREKTIISGSLKSYLFRSVHNSCLNIIKHEKVKANYVSYSNYYDSKYQVEVEEKMVAKELSERIEEAINTLPTQCARIFRMNRMDELKYKEIAKELNLSVKTVENQIGKALKLMRGSLADYLVGLILIYVGI